ncbi:MAG: IS630 family transposase [Bacteroidota bacterium]|nr:IS630 family transposase [Bacteroidota bacterium]
MDEKYTNVNLYFQDESRFGLFTRNGKALTAKGIKPICPFHQIFKTVYLFGAFSPVNGEKFLLEMPHCNSDTFQIFLNELSLQNPTEFKIMVLDNGAFHKANSLIIPENIALIFLPPYSPKLNPAENVWAILKRKFTNKIHHSLEEVSDFIKIAIADLTTDKIKSICGFEYVFSGLNWTK